MLLFDKTSKKIGKKVKQQVKGFFRHLSEEKTKRDCVSLHPLGRCRSKKVLISYVTRPFFEKSVPLKPNSVWVKQIADWFISRGYSVDVVHYKNRSYNTDYSQYAIVFGMGFPFEESIKRTGPRGKIFFATGAHSLQRDCASFERSRYFKERHSVWLPPDRLKSFPDIISTVGSDLILTTGNEWTANTYREVSSTEVKITPVDLSGLNGLCYRKKNWESAKRKFFWMGGKGPLLKGLDLLIDSFSNINNGCELHIAGSFTSDFLNHYEKTLKNSPNIFYHGYLDVSGSKFSEISEECGFVIYPGASEAGCIAVLSAMATGMIPLVTKETSIDVSSCGGGGITSPTVSEITRIIEEWSNKNNDELSSRSGESRNFVTQNHSPGQFKRSFSKALDEYLCKHAF